MLSRTATAYYIAENNPELISLPPLSQMLELQVCATTPSSELIIKIWENISLASSNVTCTYLLVQSYVAKHCV